MADIEESVATEVVRLAGSNPDGSYSGPIQQTLGSSHATDRYNKKIAQLKEYSIRGIDINSLPILKNNRGMSLMLNDGSLIYTE